MSDTSHRILVLLTGVVLSVIGIVSGIMGWWGQVAIVMWFGMVAVMTGIVLVFECVDARNKRNFEV
jgi:uncharacterized membrane protein HdeD (DUF308 family)